MTVTISDRFVSSRARAALALGVIAAYGLAYLPLRAQVDIVGRAAGDCAPRVPASSTSNTTRKPKSWWRTLPKNKRVYSENAVRLFAKSRE